MGAFICADLHLGHKHIHTYRGFATPEEHDEYVEAAWREVVRSNKRDTVYVLGDIAFSEEAWLRFDALPGRKTVILGNHCTERVDVAFIAGLKTVNSVHSMLNHKGFLLTHAPVHPKHLRGKRNIHGHLHEKLVHDHRYMNVSIEHTNFQPRSWEHMNNLFLMRKDLLWVFFELGTVASLRRAAFLLRDKLKMLVFP